MREETVISPAGHWSGTVPQGHRLRITDLEGGQGVDFLCYNANQHAERYHAPNTLKAALTLKLSVGHTLYSDEARPIFLITDDTVGGHDTIGGCCSQHSNQLLYGVENCTGCRENFLSALAPYGMDRRDIVPNINFFCNVPVDTERTLEQTVFVPGDSVAGDYVELEAKMNALAVVSNCPQVNNPCNGGNPTAIRIVISS